MEPLLTASPERPVFAGLDPGIRTLRIDYLGAPRVRGVGPLPQRRRARQAASAPCSRGWTVPRYGPGVPCRERPVFAGLDPAASMAPTTNHRAPRVRGVGPLATRASSSLSRSAPCSRGWTREIALILGLQAERPVFAGLDPQMFQLFLGGVGAPRVRGVGPSIASPSRLPTRSAPCSRGWTRGPSSGGARHPERPVFAGLDPPNRAGFAPRR